MKMKHFVWILFAMGSLSATAQNFQTGTITRSDGTEMSGRVALDNNLKIIQLKTGTQVQRMRFDQISKVTLGDRTYLPVDINGANWLTHSMVVGKASLSHAGGDHYVVKNAQGIARDVSISQDGQRITGILSVLFSDCNEIRDELNKQVVYSERALTSFVNAYNQCSSYGAYTPSESEIKRANTHNTDVAQFYAGVGAGFNSVSFFDNSATENSSAFGLQAGVLVSPAFLGSIQGNLHFLLEGSALFSGSSNFTADGTPVDFKRNTYRAFLGSEYHFNKNGNFQPFVGIAVGVSSDSFDGSIRGFSFDISGGNTIYAPRAGVVLPLNNGGKIGATIQYIPEYENDLTFPTQDEVIPLIVNTSALTLGVNYFF